MASKLLMVNKEMSRSRRAFYLIDTFSYKTLDFLAVEAMNINAEKPCRPLPPQTRKLLNKNRFF